MKRPNLKSARAAMNLAAILEYRTLKKEQEQEDMANRKTAKKQRLKAQKKQEQALQQSVQTKPGGDK